MLANDEELAKQFKNWNPMRDAYEDSTFNTYSTGPGAELEDSLQPAEIAKQSEQNKSIKNPYLVFKHVPLILNQEGLMNICSTFGKCVRSRKHGEDMIFIDFATINDMERVFTGLQNNTFGFKVELGRNRNLPPKSQYEQKSTERQANQPSLPSQKIDYERSYQVSSRNAPRPQFAKSPIVGKDDYDDLRNNLHQNDPQRHFQIEDDAHELDRIPYGNKTISEDGRFNYHTGRAYYTMSQKGKQFIEEKQKDTVGSYDANTRLQRINLEKQALTNAGQILQDLNKALAKGKCASEVESMKGTIRKKILEMFSKSAQAYENAKIGPCEHCGKICDTVCSRCMSCFCSVVCQKNEWHRHRYICGKPASMWPAWAKQLARQRKAMETREETQSAMSSEKDSTKKPALKSQLPPSGNNVILTAVSKTNVVFVRSTLYDDDLEFFNAISKIQKVAKNQSHILHTPERGDIVLTKFRENQFNRAMILNPDNLDQIKLIYVDYGNVDSKSLDELYNAPPEFWDLPRMAVPVILKNVPEFYMTDEVRKFMYSYLNTELKIVYDNEDLDNGINLAELFDLTNNESFNKVVTSFKAVAAEKKKTPILYRDFLQQLPLPTGENVELLVIDSSLLQTGFVSCSTKAYVNEIEKFQKEIQTYVRSNETKSTYTPRINELCLAKYTEDNLWYRGRCIELVGDGHPTILFFDYGNVSIVSLENIRKYPEEFTFPIMTADCEIKGLPAKVEDELKEKLEEILIPGTKLTCNNVEYFKEDNFYSIDLGDLLKDVLA